MPKRELSSNRAVLLDRDGVIIANRSSYVRRWADVSIYPSALAALARLSQLDYKIALITNQSVVGRGIISAAQAEGINQKLVGAIVAAGGRIDAVFMCPHAPQAHCLCRKPQPGLLLQAATALQLDLSRSFFIGDALSDLQAGRAAQVGEVILVKSGRGAAQLLLPEATGLAPFPIFEDLAEALAALLKI